MSLTVQPERCGWPTKHRDPCDVDPTHHVYWQTNITRSALRRVYWRPVCSYHLVKFAVFVSLDYTVTEWSAIPIPVPALAGLPLAAGDDS